MLGNGIISQEIEDIRNNLRPFLENTEFTSYPNCVPKGTSLAHAVNSMMTEEEAKVVVKEINNACSRVRNLLVELEKRQGYLVLGFANMSQLMKSDLFARARSTLQKELLAGRIESDNLNVPIGTLPERHLRPLAKLKSDYYGEAIGKAKELAGDRAMTAKDVKLAVAQLAVDRPETARRSIIDTIKEKTFIPLTESAEYAVGNVVIVKASGDSTLRPYDGCWGIIERISAFAYHVCISVVNEVIQSKGDELKRVELGQADREQIKLISDRIAALQKYDLDDADNGFLELLQHRTVWTQRQLLLLGRIEQDYGIC